MCVCVCVCVSVCVCSIQYVMRECAYASQWMRETKRDSEQEKDRKSEKSVCEQA